MTIRKQIWYLFLCGGCCWCWNSIENSRASSFNILNWPMLCDIKTKIHHYFEEQNKWNPYDRIHSVDISYFISWVYIFNILLLITLLLNDMNDDNKFDWKKTKCYRESYSSNDCVLLFIFFFFYNSSSLFIF